MMTPHHQAPLFLHPLNALLGFQTSLYVWRGVGAKTCIDIFLDEWCMLSNQLNHPRLWKAVVHTI